MSIFVGMMTDWGIWNAPLFFLIGKNVFLSFVRF